MRVWLFLLLPLIAVACEPMHRASSDPRPQVEYVSDPEAFKTADDPSLTAAERRAIDAARQFVQREFPPQWRGNFKVAPSGAGHQIDFFMERQEEDGSWAMVEGAEAWGAIWVDADGQVIRADIGP